MPSVWDAGASHGLTPLRANFIDSEKCSVPVQDISKTNHVIGIGTVMHHFKASNGDNVCVPSIACHLPRAEIRLMSPQAYHQVYGGTSELDGNRVVTHMPPPERLLDPAQD